MYHLSPCRHFRSWKNINTLICKSQTQYIYIYINNYLDDTLNNFCRNFYTLLNSTKITITMDN